MLHLLMILTAAAAAAGLPAAAEAKDAPPAVGVVVPDFSLKDIHRRPRSLAGYPDKKAVVVAFVDTECPLANLFVPSLIELHKEYAGKGVQFLAINSSNQDSFISVSADAQDRHVPFPVLKDFDQKVANAFGATRTPEVFLLDAHRVIRYHGRIDDQYGIGFRRDRPSRRDLKEALDELLAGRPITRPQTDVSGCPIERYEPSRTGQRLTYAEHAAVILQKRCQECHRPGEIGPFPLLTYEDARKRTRRIREAVLEQRMPPWHADPRYGRFSNDRRLTQQERDTLLAWIDSGALKGDDKDLPPPLTFVNGWKIGEPEKVYSMEQEFRVPATGVLDYQRFVVDPGFPEDVWVQAAECRPGNRKVVHHILVYILAPGRRDPYDRDGTAATLVGWAPGDMPALYAPDTARRIPARSKLLFEVHYTPNGTEQTDRSSVGVRFAKKPPAHSVEMNILANMFLLIPPGAPNVEGQMTFTFPRDALVLSFMPHMHLRGISARYELTYPDGQTETLLSVPDYDFGWQSAYRLEQPLRVPKGSQLKWIGHWDNSPDNPRNPDPTKTVHWGLQTWDEMQNGWMEVVWQQRKS
ncbi:MAG TPA: redoxin domain-containing protein [Isosphaeraceae bacterium]|nr:redoxin domain-containing protein [Isosphaeraceae bacterium]